MATVVDALIRGPGWDSAPLRVAGLSLLLTGVVALRRPTARRLAVLMVLCGASAFLGDLRYSPDTVLFALGFWFSYLYASLFVQLALAYPTGSLRGRLDRVLVVLSYLAAVGSQVAQYVLDGARYPWLDRWQENTAVGRAGSLACVVVAVLVGGRLAWKWAHTSRPERRVTAGPWGVALAGGAAALGSGVASVTAASTAVRLVPFGLSMTVAALLPVAMLVGVARVHLARGRTAGFIVELEDDPDPRHLQAALARVLGDPTLGLAFRLPDGSGWVDIVGQPVTPAPHSSDRHHTPVRRRGQDLAMLTHDPALTGQRPLMDAVLAAAGLALDNARLYASLQAQLTEVSASRLRIAQAAVEERSRIQRDLHDGAQQQLLAILILLDSTRHALTGPAGPAEKAAGRDHDLAMVLVGKAHHELQRAVGQLRDLSHGIYPSILLEQGLAAAVEMVTDQAPCPVAVTIPATRWPQDIEVNAYFFITEALTNVYKHAAASYASVVVVSDPDSVSVTVTDDGRGGARPGSGAGLRNVHDRVAAVGGRIGLDSPLDGGTRLSALFPLENACA